MGQYIDHKTPATHTGGNFHLPFREVVLEYSMSEAGFSSGVPRNNVRPSTVLIWISQLSVDEAVMFPIYRATIKGDADWVPPLLGLLFGNQSRMTIDSRGAITADITVKPLSDRMFDKQQLEQLTNDCNDELKVLVHFSQICQSANIAVRSNPWPPGIGPDDKPLPAENYYTLTGTGPTSFRWLPTAGMPPQ
ncbi:MAG: hypothetical protein ACJ8R9_11280 [Steroidobacteraceae bacterium]